MRSSMVGSLLRVAVDDEGADPDQAEDDGDGAGQGSGRRPEEDRRDREEDGRGDLRSHVEGREALDARLLGPHEGVGVRAVVGLELLDARRVAHVGGHAAGEEDQPRQDEGHRERPSELHVPELPAEEAADDQRRADRAHDDAVEELAPRPGDAVLDERHQETTSAACA